MFSRKKEKELDMSEPLNKTHSTLAYSATITGEITVNDNLRVDGNVDGNISCNGRLIIGPEACVRGNIKSSNIVLMGKIYGDVAVSDSVVLKSTSYYMGEIKTRNIEIEPGASFYGNCKTED